MELYFQGGGLFPPPTYFNSAGCRFQFRIFSEPNDKEIMLYKNMKEFGNQVFLTGEHAEDLLINHNLSDALGLYQSLIVSHCVHTGEIESIYGFNGKIPSPESRIFPLFNVLPVAGRRVVY